MNTIRTYSNASEPNLADSDHTFGIDLHSTNAQRLMVIPPATAFMPLTQEEFDGIIARVHADPDAADLADILMILFHTGLRAGELARLQWRDVSLDAMQLTVAPMKDTRKRKVPFGHKVQRILEAREEQDPNAKYVLGNDPFQTLDKARRKLFDLQSGSNNRLIGLHLLRRTYFVRWINNGGSLEELSVISGFPLSARDRKSSLSPKQLFASAALFQARLEDG